METASLCRGVNCKHRDGGANRSETLWPLLVYTSKYQLQTELNLPRRVGLAADYSELHIPKCTVRPTKLRRVEQVEELGSELEIRPFSDRESLERREVEVGDAVLTNIRQEAAHVAIGERLGLGKDRRVKPPIN